MLFFFHDIWTSIVVYIYPEQWGLMQIMISKEGELGAVPIASMPDCSI